MTMTRVCLVALLSATTLLTACDPNPTSWKTPNMTTLSPRFQPLFEKTKTVCFGRFLIDVPETVEVVWGESDIPLDVQVYKNEAAKLAQVVTEREQALKAEPRFPLSKKLSLYFETRDGVMPGMKHIISQESFSGKGLLRINSFYAMGPHLVQLNARPLEEQKGRAIATLNDIARRLRPRDETEIPAESGVCIKHAFLPDNAMSAEEKLEPEHIRVGFRLKEFPDVHLSIYVAPANPHDTSGDSLEGQLKRTEDDARKSGSGDPYKGIKFFRKDKRQIHDWQTGYEVLTRTPDEEGVHGYKDFWLKFTGVANDLLKPYADIQLKTGVENNAAGAIKSSLTDEEAIALWDKLTGSIRARKASDASAKPVSVAEPERAPLGELAATGRTCPQTGWWQCSEGGEVAGGKRQHFTAGQRMPRAVLLGEPSIWQKFKNERPSHKTATVWQLVDYDAVPVVAKAETATPPHTDAQSTPPRDAEDAPPSSEG